jgi:succinate dehydrogenase / fumarate reductase cytochrome b subunit
LSSAIAPPSASHAPHAANPAHFLLRRLHSLTGLIFSGYVVVHLSINATLLQGTSPDVFQTQVDKIHSLPFLAIIEWTAIYLPIIFHTVYGIYHGLAMRPNVGEYNYTKNWFYVFQRISAIILVVFLLFHVLTMKGVFGGEFGRELTFVPHAHATQSTFNHIKAAWWVTFIIYPIGLLAGTYHLANGVWTAAITWGLTISARAQRRFGYLCIGLFVFTTACAFGAWGKAVLSERKPIPEQAEYVDPNKSAIPSPSDVIKTGENVIRGEDKPLPSK